MADLIRANFPVACKRLALHIDETNRGSRPPGRIKTSLA